MIQLPSRFSISYSLVASRSSWGSPSRIMLRIGTPSIATTRSPGRTPAATASGLALWITATPARKELLIGRTGPWLALSRPKNERPIASRAHKAASIPVSRRTRRVDAGFIGPSESCQSRTRSERPRPHIPQRTAPGPEDDRTIRSSCPARERGDGIREAPADRQRGISADRYRAGSGSVGGP